MAFVINEDNEDRVSFYTRNDVGKVCLTEYIQRGDSDKLNYLIKQYMFPKKQMQLLSQNKLLKKRH